MSSKVPSILRFVTVRTRAQREKEASMVLSPIAVCLHVAKSVGRLGGYLGQGQGWAWGPQFAHSKNTSEGQENVQPFGVSLLVSY